MYNTSICKNLHKIVHELCSKCVSCKFLKRNKKQHDKLPTQKAEVNLWDVLCGGKDYKLKNKKGHSVYLQAVTMITSWVEIYAVPSACADLVANKVQLTWLTRYPLPNKVI